MVSMDMISHSVFINTSIVATMGFENLWKISSVTKYYLFMTRFFITVVQSRDKSPQDNTPIVKVLSDLYKGPTSSLGHFIDQIQH
jgi:hypothetical protein